MEEQLQQILAQAREGVGGLAKRADFEAFKAKLTGPKGALTLAAKQIGQLDPKERPVFGKRVNEVKKEVEEVLAGALQKIEEAELKARLGPPVDPSLPGPDSPAGSRHPLAQVREEICAIFRRAGFTVAEGPEVETDHYCFDALNFPPDHVARDMQDTYFLPREARFGNVKKHGDEPYLLRTHTSTVQIRTMLAEEPPLRIVAPGRCFRRDTADATHSANFHQVEGLYVDRKVAVTDLKAILDYFVQSLFGTEVETRLRPSFFPFTEPSFEMDFRAPDLGKLSGQWIEIMGCGMVDPNVFAQVGYDPEQWSGYAFGMGVERIAMLLYGVDDIRHFYQNDLRFLRQFA